MTLERLSEVLECENIYKAANYSRITVKHVAAGDLMSEVLVADKDHIIILTALTSEQVIRTADIVDAAGVILINGKKPMQGMVDLAKDLDISLFSTEKSMYEACVSINKIL